MITDPNKSEAYLNNGISPFLDYINTNGYKDQVAAIELFNEPEWMIEGGSGVTRTIGLKSV